VKTILIAAAAFLAAGPANLAQARGAVITGVPLVLDGDTIVVSGLHVRLNGLDAEETAHFGKPAEPHGDAAASKMQEIVGIGAPVRCELNGDRTYNRLVGVCFNARGQDVAAELVKAGLALDCAHYSGGRYRRFEPAGARARLIQKPYC
jgi:endonuclease YncB( thermonuclease family)